MKITVKILILFTLCLTALSANAQDEKFKSAYLYQFGRIMNWPETTEDFVIGVWGDSEITPLLEKIAEIKKINERKITIRRINETSQLDQCQLVFVPLQASGVLEKVRQATLQKGVLVVSEKKGAVKSGAGISYIKVDDKILFEINRQNIEAAGLKISLALERIAFKVY